MRVYLPKQENPQTGKYLFIGRLAEAMEALGAHLVFDPHEASDVSLHIVITKDVKSKKKVIRLDGVYHEKGRHPRQQNKRLLDKGRLHKADGIIYQTNFCKQMAGRYLGLDKYRGPTAVINNGANPQFYDGIEPAHSDSAYNFLAIARWSFKRRGVELRGYKRLIDIIESYLLADLQDSTLWVAGDLDVSRCRAIAKYVKLPNIKFIGWLDEYDLGSYLRMCDASIHLAWLDWCPNSVVEALCAGCPVITNNVGGTCEIVGPAGGIICDLDAPFDFGLVHRDKPPKIDRRKVAQAIRKLLDVKPVIDRRYLSIDKIARQYLDFFESL